MRQAAIERKTKETDISLALNLDGTGKAAIDSGCGFLDHMLELFAYHGQIDLTINCQGDTQVDDHHTVEDIGIALGTAVLQALGDKKGILRYGNFLLPMDEALVLCAIDFSGRDYLGYQVNIPAQKVGNFDTELVQEFMLAFVRNARATLHFHQLAGSNSHHIMEAMFKGLGKAMRQAIGIDPGRPDEAPSSKGVL
ncbi:MAG: imidazoleglycerol-phosphate dehydratase HisB [Clostridiales bacterium]|nr:imidazoleglycerol-phosphate dehydratase HisB [Clostridiales bacterium]